MTGSQFRLHKSHLSDPKRLMRLLIASCLAYIWVVYLGVCALRDGWLQRLHRQDRCYLVCFGWACGCLHAVSKIVVPSQIGCSCQLSLQASPAARC